MYSLMFRRPDQPSSKVAYFVLIIFALIVLEAFKIPSYRGRDANEMQTDAVSASPYYQGGGVAPAPDCP
jgi:hypothetical protein